MTVVFVFGDCGSITIRKLSYAIVCVCVCVCVRVCVRVCERVVESDTVFVRAWDSGGHARLRHGGGYRVHGGVRATVNVVYTVVHSSFAA